MKDFKDILFHLKKEFGKMPKIYKDDFEDDVYVVGFRKNIPIGRETAPIATCPNKEYAKFILKCVTNILNSKEKP